VVIYYIYMKLINITIENLEEEGYLFILTFKSECEHTRFNIESNKTYEDIEKMGRELDEIIENLERHFKIHVEDKK
jgi:hypothetical protein